MNYYNEFDPSAAAWLRELIAMGLIPDGEVDERSIQDVKPADLVGFNQCHFFAGIGGWSLALRLAGVPDDYPVWTGSCPCQPFSQAGKGKGVNDERHLWPVFAELIRACKPAIAFGEQVASKAGREWLAGVFADLEGVGYQRAAADLCAAGVGSPHIRQRLFWLAYADATGSIGRGASGGLEAWECAGVASGSELGGLAYTDRSFVQGLAPEQQQSLHRNSAEIGGLGIAHGAGSQPRQLAATSARYGRAVEPAGSAGGLGDPLRDAGQLNAGELLAEKAGVSGANGAQYGHLPERSKYASTGLGFWSDFDLIPCGDGKARRTQRGIFPLAYGLPGGVVSGGADCISEEEANTTSEARVMRLKGYGNAIVPQVAAEFIRAFFEEK